MKKICLLGASGSIGKQTLDVLAKNRNDFQLVSFSVGKNTKVIQLIIKKFPEVKAISMIDHKKRLKYQREYPHITFYEGDDGLLKVIDQGVDMVVNALVGFVGLRPSIYTLENGIDLALANKESLVVGGELINSILKRTSAKLYPIDSEHSALTKCLLVDNEHVSKLMLTASGGAFRNLTREQLKDVTPEDALKHPTWKMGPKITIDCATMVNKAFEVIEAHYLFKYPVDKIGIKLHDESYIHSYVIYDDGKLRVDMGKPDMRIPIKLALYGFEIDFKTIYVKSLDNFKKLHFHDFDISRYPIVKYATKVINEKGTYGAVFNASNEEAVKAFLNHEISFLDIEDIISICMDEHKTIEHPTYEFICFADKKTRERAKALIKERRRL